MVVSFPIAGSPIHCGAAIAVVVRPSALPPIVVRHVMPDSAGMEPTPAPDVVLPVAVAAEVVAVVDS